MYFSRAQPLCRAAPDHLGVIDAVLEEAWARNDEAERRVERLQARLRGDANRRAGPDLGSVGDGAGHGFSPQAAAAPGGCRDHPADRRLGVLRARLEQARIGERLALHGRPRGQVIGPLVEPVRVHEGTLLLDREDGLASHVDVLQLAHGERVEGREAPHRRLPPALRAGRACRAFLAHLVHLGLT